MDHPRLCKKCGEMKMPTEFQPNKKHCKECFIPADELKKLYATSEIGKQKRKELKVKKQTVIKAKKEKSIVKIPKEIKVKERKRTQTKANQRKPPQKAIIETPDKIIKVKTILYQKVKIDNCRRTNKFVRKGWDEIMNQIRLKIECSTI